MSVVGYNKLQERISTPVVLQGLNCDVSPELTLAAKSQPSSSYTFNDLEPDCSAQRDISRQDNRTTPAEYVKYTALQPTSVLALDDHDGAASGEYPGSSDLSILVRAASCSRRRPIPRVYVVICSLLIASVVLVAFALVYVFVVLPLNPKSGTRPEPGVHPEDSSRNSDDLLVSTSCGSVRGFRDDEVIVFRGIPYALPPTNDRRWKPPVARLSDPTSCWTNVYNASNFGSQCLQPTFNNSSVVEGSEDCLFLNVWTPSLTPESLLPVMVWFHSGDFIYGSGHAAAMSPTPSVTRATNAVYVSFNYRLGLLGFLAIEELREGTDSPVGNYGFLDQLLVLKWVQRNIRLFGGDNKAVCLFGHGSGATSIQALVMSSSGQGLFHKVWISGPAPILNQTREEAYKDGKSFLRHTGCSNAECLRSLPVDKIFKSSPWSLGPHWTLTQLFNTPKVGQHRNGLPIFEGQEVSPASHSRKRHTVPIIFGSSSFDVSSLETVQEVVNMTDDQYNSTLHQLLNFLTPEALQQVILIYSQPSMSSSRNIRFPSAPSLRFLRLLGDLRSVCPVKILTEAWADWFSNSSLVYMYLADLGPSHNLPLGSNSQNTFLGWDLVAFFDTFQELGFKAGQGEFNFQSLLREEVMAFVRQGQPDAARWKPVWETVGVIGRDVTVWPLESNNFDQCGFFRQQGFFRYSWNT